MIVGPTLALINQTATVGQLLTGGEVERVAVMRIALTFMVPFVVSLVSAALADAQRT